MPKESDRDEDRPLGNTPDNRSSNGPEREPSSLRQFMQRLRRLEARSQDITGRLDPRTGNGWAPEKIVEAVFMVDPVSVRTAVDEGKHAKTSSVFRLKTALRLSKNPVKVVGQPIVLFVPVWHLKGFHECYYLRSSSYRIPVKRDVVGVEVDGRSRDILLEKKQRLISRVLKGRLSRLESLFANESKYFAIDDITELANFKREEEIFVGAKAGEHEFLDQYELSGWKLRRIFDASGLKVEGASIAVGSFVESKEGAVAELKERLVRLPESAKEILTNRFEVTQLNLYYVPFYSVTMSVEQRTESILIHGVTGEIVTGELAKEILRRVKD